MHVSKVSQIGLNQKKVTISFCKFAVNVEQSDIAFMQNTKKKKGKSKWCRQAL